MTSSQTQNGNIATVFAQNLISLLGDQHTITSLSRDLGIHRTQLQRFINGESFPKPDILQLICNFFDVDARILTHPLEHLQQIANWSLPDTLLADLEPVSHELFPDGFYEEWRTTIGTSQKYSCQLLRVKTIGRVRWTKVKVRKIAVMPEGEVRELNDYLTFIGAAVKQAGGLCILDRPSEGRGLTFTALRLGAFGEPDLFSGHKRSVRSVGGSGLIGGSATAIRKLQGGLPAAMELRRQPRFRSPEETPEMIKWLLKEQLATQNYG